MIPPERIDQVVRIVEQAGLNDQTLGILREVFTDLHFTYCLDDDLGVAEPVREARGFNLYLVDGQSYCLRLTKDLDAATGLVLAELEPED